MEKKESEDILYFPRNASASYQLFGIEGLGWSSIKRYILPTLGILILFFLIPPYNSIFFWIIKSVLLVFALIFNIFMIMLKPVPERKNITLEMWFAYRRQYSKRQKEYFINKKDRKINGK